MKKNSPFVRYIGIILTIILSSLFFITIYSVDNKYTQSSVQPIDGMLILTEDDLDNNPSNFLIRGWRFYPNVLLTPEQYNENASELYSTYVSIGENTGLTDENGVAPHGYGTYVLTLVLPEKTETYALYLPEIYCAYRLYIDDEEIISAAILHDTVEDCDGVTVEMIEAEFSARVANLVAQESEDKSRSWEERKGATIERMRIAPRAVKLIGLGDKLSNMRGIDQDYQEVGEEVWNRFRKKDKNIIGWYYKGLRDSFRSEFDGEPAYTEYSKLVEKVFGK